MLSRRAAAATAAAVAVLALAACSQAAGTASPAVTGPSPASDPQAASPGAASGQAPDPSVRVDWGDGRNVPGMNRGVPNPPGWYDAAFGGPAHEKVLYLTFDDGPWPRTTSRLLALLRKYDASATFFVVGQQVRKHPQLVRAIAASGNAMGDHTRDHADLVALGATAARRQLAAVQDEVGASLGGCMRPPYGLIDAQVAAISASLHLTPILWTAHASDWDQPPVARMVASLKHATRSGAVLLLHDGGGPRNRTVTATARMLPWWREHGYRLDIIAACRPAAGSAG